MARVATLGVLLLVCGGVLRADDAQAAPYNGPRSGTLQCSGGRIPQNGEFVFRDVPQVKLHLDYDKKLWDARLETLNGQPQRLIIKNIGKGPQKTCVVHWTVVP
jgi:hypothetical protein